MLELFNNPGYFAAGSALVSAPVVIHLINRMRFRRLRWAAMEFLLKAQKRNRRRLIIEQLILLALRCMLIMLAALLVLRFVGFSLAGYSGQDSLHIVVLDDTLSMTDQWKEGGVEKNCFKVAKEDVILNNILKKVAQSTTNERLVILPLSEVARDPAYQATVWQKLAEHSVETEIIDALKKMQPTKLHTDLAIGLEAASNLIEKHPDHKPVIHIVSDFRVTDWSGEQAEKLKKALERLSKQKAGLRLWDTAHPMRLEEQGGVPISHDNVAIVDFKANSRLVGKGMPVTFSVTVANNSPNDKKVNVVIYRFQSDADPKTGAEIIKLGEQGDLNFVPTMPFNVPANSSASATFKYTPQKVPENVDFLAERFCVHLETDSHGPLEDDGILGDNIRWADVQIRNKIPFLIIDGAGSSSDGTAYVETALKSISNSYDVFYGDLVSAKEDGTEALKSGKLMNYAAIYLLNVEKLTEDKKGGKGEDAQKLKNLENYVKEGGSVVFFLGPKVSGKYYTEKLHYGLFGPEYEKLLLDKESELGDKEKAKAAVLKIYQDSPKGIFPAPLNDIPVSNEVVEKDPVTKFLSLGSGMLLRDDKVSLKNLPIFGNLILKKAQQESLKMIMVHNHFVVPREQWQSGKGKVQELAALPNKKNAKDIGLDDSIGKVLAKDGELDTLLKSNPAYQAEYGSLLKSYQTKIEDIIFTAKAFQIGQVLDQMLNDAGDPTKPDAPNLKKFWNQNDPKIGELHKKIKDIAEFSLFGDPFIVTQQFGKGRVVAVMTSAGGKNDTGPNAKIWSDWPFGLVSGLWPLFHKYSLEYLFDQAAESSLLVGQPYSIEVKTQKYLEKGAKQLKLVRTFFDAKVNQTVKLKDITEPGTVKDGIQTFTFPRNDEDGFYLSQLFSDVDSKKPLEAWEHVFNVDTRAESKLQRIAQEDAKANVLYKDYGNEKIKGFGDPSGDRDINKQTDLSDSPWFYLLFLIVLISEQALAVHLSYHLRGAENQVPAQVATSQLRAA